jgi:hypothetical protein
MQRTLAIMRPAFFSSLQETHSTKRLLTRQSSKRAGDEDMAADPAIGLVEKQAEAIPRLSRL